MATRTQHVQRAVLAACAFAGTAALGCTAMPHRDGSSRSSAGLDVSAPAILSYRPLSEGGERFMKQFQPPPQTHANDRLLIRDRRGKQMAADDVTQWAGPTP